MSDFFEIDFLNVGAKESGDAIPLRYSIGGDTRIHVTDGGFQDTGDKIIKHIKTYYDNPSRIDAVIVTHPDGDHTGGLAKVIEHFNVSELWMLRPWLYAGELIDCFPRWRNEKNLISQLKDVYSNIAELEEFAEQKMIRLRDPFQGSKIGEFTVLSPTKKMYLNLVVESDKTPEATKGSANSLLGQERTTGARVVPCWGEENFSSEETSPDNEMSVVQYANLCGQRILLTGDAGRGALAEAAAYAPWAGLTLPGIDRFQIPHHGSRRNVSTEILDCWLGGKLPDEPEPANERFTAIISASKEDKDHPRKAVIRACIHRGARVCSNQDEDFYTYHNKPLRQGWHVASNLPYPKDQETDQSSQRSDKTV